MLAQKKVRKLLATTALLVLLTAAAWGQSALDGFDPDANGILAVDGMGDGDDTVAGSLAEPRLDSLTRNDAEISDAYSLGEGRVALQWDPNLEPDIAGYHLRYGHVSGHYFRQIDVGNTTTAAVSNLTGGRTYFFVVAAYNIRAVESPPSNEVSARARGGSAPSPTPTPPPPPPPNCLPIEVGPNDLPDGKVGLSYSNYISASGGNGPYTFTASSGSLPPGLTLSPWGLLSGTPITAAAYNFTIRTRDSIGCIGFGSCRLEITLR